MTRRSDMMFGVEVGQRLVVRSARAARPSAIRIGDWPSGLYFARLRAADGRVGFAPFVVRAAAARRAPGRDRDADDHVAGVQPPRRRRRRRG